MGEQQAINNYHKIALVRRKQKKTTRPKPISLNERKRSTDGIENEERGRNIEQKYIDE